MLMEAMRLSLIEHEEQQRKEADKKRKEEAERAAKKGEGSGTGNFLADNPGAFTFGDRPLPESALRRPYILPGMHPTRGSTLVVLPS